MIRAIKTVTQNQNMIPESDMNAQKNSPNVLNIYFSNFFIKSLRTSIIA